MGSQDGKPSWIRFTMAHRRGRILKAKAIRIGFLEEAGLLDKSILQLGESIESNPHSAPFLQKMKVISRERVWLNRRPHAELGRD